MGCTNSFMYHSQAYKDILYSEKIDKRLGKIYLMRSAATNTAYIAKELVGVSNEVAEAKINKHRYAFGSASKLFLLPLGVAEKLAVLNCEQASHKKSAKSCYLKIEFFQRDFSDEFNVKALKQKKFYGFELWSLVYTFVFAFAAVEDHSLPFIRVRFDDILITNNSYKYYYRPFFEDLVVIDEAEELTFDELKMNLAFMIFEMSKDIKLGELLDYDPKFFTAAYFRGEFEKMKTRWDEELKGFIYSALITNSAGQDSFAKLRDLLVQIYDKMDYEVIDEKIIQDYRER